MILESHYEWKIQAKIPKIYFSLLPNLSSSFQTMAAVECLKKREFRWIIQFILLPQVGDIRASTRWWEGPRKVQRFNDRATNLTSPSSSSTRWTKSNYLFSPLPTPRGSKMCCGAKSRPRLWFFLYSVIPLGYWVVVKTTCFHISRNLQITQPAFLSL